MFPSGTTFAGYTGGQVIDVTTATPRSAAAAAPGLTIICDLFSNQAIAASDHVQIVFNGIANPARAPHAHRLDHLRHQPVTSAPYTVLPAN